MSNLKDSHLGKIYWIVERGPKEGYKCKQCKYKPNLWTTNPNHITFFETPEEAFAFAQDLRPGSFRIEQWILD